MTVPVSVLLIARDEEAQLEQSLPSVSGWAGETLVVIDPRTADHSREVAFASGATVLEHEYVSSAAQYNWGAARCRHDWVFVLDADERVTGGLRAGIERALAAPRHPAYAVRRVNFAFGRRLRFGDWGHDRIVRVFDRRAARFDERAVHGAVRAASVGRLDGELEHRSLRSLDQYLPKVHEFARRGASDLRRAGRSSGLAVAITRAEWRFVRAYFLRLGVLDGFPGLVVAILAAYGTFLKWTMVWEATRRCPRP
ncbi:MAG: glycosyltransferase family 2 protein [Acidobacteriota bacterium]